MNSPIPPVPPVSSPGGSSMPAGMPGAGGEIPPPPPVSPPLNPSGGAGRVYGADGRQNLLGYLAVAFGILGTGCCCCPFLNGAPFLGGIPALVLGFLHLQKVKKGQATMGWLGWLGIALAALALIGAIFQLTTNFSADLQDQYSRFGDY